MKKINSLCIFMALLLLPVTAHAVLIGGPGNSTNVTVNYVKSTNPAYPYVTTTIVPATATIPGVGVISYTASVIPKKSNGIVTYTIWVKLQKDAIIYASGNKDIPSPLPPLAPAVSGYSMDIVVYSNQ